jgi:hypothetical protein
MRATIARSGIMVILILRCNSITAHRFSPFGGIRSVV